MIVGEIRAVIARVLVEGDSIQIDDLANALGPGMSPDEARELAQLLVQAADRADGKPRKARAKRVPAPRRDPDGDVICPDCGKAFIHERAYKVHRGRVHKGAGS